LERVYRGEGRQGKKAEREGNGERYVVIAVTQFEKSSGTFPPYYFLLVLRDIISLW